MPSVFEDTPESLASASTELCNAAAALVAPATAPEPGAEPSPTKVSSVAGEVEDLEASTEIPQLGANVVNVAMDIAPGPSGSAASAPGPSTPSKRIGSRSPRRGGDGNDADAKVSRARPKTMLLAVLVLVLQGLANQGDPQNHSYPRRSLPTSLPKCPPICKHSCYRPRGLPNKLSRLRSKKVWKDGSSTLHVYHLRGVVIAKYHDFKIIALQRALEFMYETMDHGFGLNCTGVQLRQRFQSTRSFNFLLCPSTIPVPIVKPKNVTFAPHSESRRYDGESDSHPCSPVVAAGDSACLDSPGTFVDKAIETLNPKKNARLHEYHVFFANITT